VTRRHLWLPKAVALLLHLTGVLMVLLSLAMLPSLALAVNDEGPDLTGFLVAATASATAGVVLVVSTRRFAQQVAVGHREGFLIVGVGWFVAGLVGALPLYFYAHLAPGDVCGLHARPSIGADFCSFTHSVFESVSGFTTTGASIITDGLWDGPGDPFAGDRLGLPRGILLWRSMTHYLGGMGIIVLGVAILPLLGVGGMQLLKAEVPGPTTDKLAPRVGETARLLWKVYLFISALEFLLLTLGGVDAFDAVNHTMATMATGGFSIYSSSIAALHSPYAEWVITVFMFLAGMNFTLHFFALRGRLGAYRDDPESRLYVAIAGGAVILVTFSLVLSGTGYEFYDALRHAAFQVATIMTTTGFASTDFDTWTFAPVALFVLVTLMFIGGMAGSTGGGIKVVRHLIMVKQWARELFSLVHPRSARPVRLRGTPVPESVVRAATGFVGVYLGLFLLGAAVFTLDGQDLTTAFTASAASLGNIGPGLGGVGPTHNYAFMGHVALWCSILLQILGRLEIYTVLVLFTPAFWRR